jgi:hypothetical protein
MSKVESRRVPDSVVRLARAVVNNSKRHGREEDPRIVAVAELPLPEDEEPDGAPE